MQEVKRKKIILAIGAHPDDIEIGCGGTLARHVAEGDEVHMLVMTYGEKENGNNNVHEREIESRNAAEALGVASINFLGYKDTELPSTVEVINKIEKFVLEFKPDRVYTHNGNDLHQDHRATHFTSLSACRNVKEILLFEGPSTKGDFSVNFWIKIDGYVQRKIDSLKAHVSQGSKEILKIDAIVGMNTFRGYQTKSNFAEAFNLFRYLE
jgi:LmbE family N-acetylglucosaminyl deacetylase